MASKTWMLTALLIGCVGTTVRAQDNPRDRKWLTVRYVGVLDAFNDFNGQGFVDYLDANGFGETEQGFLGPIDNPRARAEGGTGWSLLAAYVYRPRLQVGVWFHRAPSVSTRGYSSGSGRIGISHEMWAVAPVAVWTPVRTLAVGIGPAAIRGSATFFDARPFLVEAPRPSQEETFLRFGAVGFVSLGVMLFRTVYLGVQGQYLWAGETEVGPYGFGERTLEASGARLDQFTVGPVVAVTF